MRVRPHVTPLVAIAVMLLPFALILSVRNDSDAARRAQIIMGVGGHEFAEMNHFRLSRGKRSGNLAAGGQPSAKIRIQMSTSKGGGL